MKPKPYKGVFLPDTYASISDELKGLFGGSLNAPMLIIATRMDELRNRVDPSTGADQRVTFTGVAGPVVVPHTLGVTPRRVELVAFSGLQAWNYSVDDKAITITATDKSTGTVDLYI